LNALEKNYKNQQCFHSAETSVVYYSSCEYYADPYDLLFEVKRLCCSLAVLSSSYTSTTTTRWWDYNVTARRQFISMSLSN